jgi:hypothetical protein
MNFDACVRSQRCRRGVKKERKVKGGERERERERERENETKTAALRVVVAPLLLVLL